MFQALRSVVLRASSRLASSLTKLTMFLIYEKWTAELKNKSDYKYKWIKMASVKWNLMHGDFTCVFSIPVKFEIYFLLFPWESFLWIYFIWTYYIYRPWKVSRRIRYSGLKYSGTSLLIDFDLNFAICQSNSIISSLLVPFSFYLFSLLCFVFSGFSSSIAFVITKLEYFRRLARDASREGALHQTTKEIHWRKLQQNTPTIG